LKFIIYYIIKNNYNFFIEGILIIDVGISLNLLLDISLKKKIIIIIIIFKFKKFLITYDKYYFTKIIMYFY